MGNQRLRVDGNGSDGGSRGHGRRHVDRSQSGGGNHDGSGVGRREDHLSVGGSGRLGDGLGAGNSLVLIVNPSTIADSRATGDANFVAGTRILLAASARAAGAMLLTVDASAIADSRATGNTDSEAGASILLAVAGGGSSESGGTTKDRKSVLRFTVRL